MGKRMIGGLLAFGFLMMLMGCVDITNAGRDVTPTPKDENPLLGSGAVCTDDTQCSSGDCVLAGETTGHCK